MKKLKLAVVFLGFFVFCVAFCTIPKLRPKILLFKSHIAEMFHLKSDGSLSYNDIPIKRIRYINSDSFEIISFSNDLINLTLSYKVSKEDRFLVLFFLNNISSPVIKIKKQLDKDYFSGDISGVFEGEKLNLKDYIMKHGAFYAK